MAAGPGLGMEGALGWRGVPARAPRSRVAAVTMSYNEPVWAAAWARHYARALGAEHCTLLDHGSDDGSAEGLPIRVRRLPRTALDEGWRAAVIADEVRALLRHYDAVIHTDVDELLVADPVHYAGLLDFADAVEEPVVTAVGLDLHHLPDAEPALDMARPLGMQREWVRFSAAMCKPVLVRRAVEWAPGFHCCDAPLVLDRLFLLHMRYADLDAGLRRLARTRGLAVVGTAGEHQRVPDAEFAGMMRAIARLPRREGLLDPWAPPLSPWLDRLRASRAFREAELYKLDLRLAGDALWRLPPEVRALV